MTPVLAAALAVVLAAACSPSGGPRSEVTTPDGGPRPGAAGESAAPSPAVAPSLPLVTVADVPLPGRPVRFDYQDVDAARGHLVLAHMNDASVVIVRLSDGAVVKVVPGVPTARGVAVAPEAERIFVTSSPNTLVILDRATLEVLRRVTTGAAPDGVGWDPVDRMVAVSDQGDGAVSLIRDAGDGARRQVSLGRETGNVVYDPGRGVFWVTVVRSAPPDQLVAIAPVVGEAKTSIPLPGCEGAHGLRLHPDGKSAVVACEDSSTVTRVDLVDPAHPLDVATVGREPDVLALDPGLGWLYVAAESGDLMVFDLTQPGLVSIDREHPGHGAHSVSVDPATHRVFFPLAKGPAGTPVLRIMEPARR